MRTGNEAAIIAVMRISAFMGLGLPLLLTGCSGAIANNVTEAVNIVAEEGIVDVNSSIEGDQLSPDLEAVDDLAGNRSVPLPIGNRAR